MFWQDTKMTQPFSTGRCLGPVINRSSRVTSKRKHILCTHMSCVGGMVEKTLCEAAGHGYESNERTHVPNLFFLRGGAFSTGHCDRY